MYNASVFLGYYEAVKRILNNSFHQVRDLQPFLLNNFPQVADLRYAPMLKLKLHEMSRMLEENCVHDVIIAPADVKAEDVKFQVKDLFKEDVSNIFLAFMWGLAV